MKRLLILLLLLISCSDGESYRITVQYENCTTGKVEITTVKGWDMRLHNDGAVPELTVCKNDGSQRRVALNVCDYKILNKEKIK